MRQWEKSPKGSRGLAPDTGGWGCIYKGVQSDPPVAAFGTDMTLRGEAMKLPRKQRSALDYSNLGYTGSRLDIRNNDKNNAHGSSDRYGRNHHDNDDDDDNCNDNDGGGDDDDDNGDGDNDDGKPGVKYQSAAQKRLSSFDDSDEESESGSITFQNKSKSNSHTGRPGPIPRPRNLGPRIPDPLSSTVKSSGNASYPSSISPSTKGKNKTHLEVRISYCFFSFSVKFLFDLSYLILSLIRLFL